MAPTTPLKTCNAQTALMHKARTSGTFDTHELTCLLYGGEAAVAARRAAFERVEKITGTHDPLKLPRTYGNMNREEAYEEGLEMGMAAYMDGLRNNHNIFDQATPRHALGNASPFGLIRLMFEPTIQLSGSEEQQAKWLPLSRRGEILGTYCQTELGHGSFIRGIETTATFVAESDEFEIHSPTLSSTKFWPGGLAFSATHAIVVARLIIRSNDLGPHLFMVQLRFLKDGSPPVGIKLGDVGLKMAYNGMDNGYASFDHVRIPRENMLMGHAMVSESGTYTASPQQARLSYSTMLMSRGIIVRVVGRQLAQAATIASRYSAVREQGLGPAGMSCAETSVLSYKTQHFRLLTLIAKSYAIHFAAQAFDTEYAVMRQQQGKGDHSSLPYIHALSAGLKAWSTQEAADGAEDARKCCGGHGFLMISGLPDIVASVTAAATFEGENYVLWQQTGRYLLKCVDRLEAGENVDPPLRYLTTTPHDAAAKAVTGLGFLDIDAQLAIYRHRARHLIFAAHGAVRTSTKSPDDAWNEHMMAIISASRAHIDYTVLSSLKTQLAMVSASPALHHVLVRLRSLFALAAIIGPYSVDAVSFVSSYSIIPGQLGMIRTLVNDVLDGLLPDVIALTDAWDFSDASLCSALGMKDGNVYERIMGWVEQLPINKRVCEEGKGVHDGWKRWVEPILKAKL